jgi:hypothetical protein
MNLPTGGPSTIASAIRHFGTPVNAPQIKKPGFDRAFG